MRKIGKEVVHEALKNADQTINQGETKISQKVIGDKMLRVIYRESGNSCSHNYIYNTQGKIHKW